MLTTGQIELTSPFGQALTEYTRQSKAILEVGFGSGLGSTQCLMAGMTSKDQQLVCTEGDGHQFEAGVDNITRTRVNCIGQVEALHGVFHRMLRPYWHPINTPAHVEEYEHCAAVTRLAPMLHPTFYQRPWDLAVLDGGEYSSDGDFLLLWPFTKVFALDDLNPQKATKNIYAAECLFMAGWKLERDDIGDRNGWAIWRRP